MAARLQVPPSAAPIDGVPGRPTAAETTARAGPARSRTGRHRADRRRGAARSWSTLPRLGCRAAVQAAIAVAWTVLVLAVMLTADVLVCLAIGWRPAVVTSASMSPAVRVGDVVVFEPAGRRPPAKGMIVLFPRPGSGELLTHRVAAVRSDGRLVTKGDANRVSDSGLLDPGSVRGQARLVLPRAGVVRLFGTAHWRSGLAWLALLVVSGVVVVLLGGPGRATGGGRPATP